jgi:acyl-CoA thioesterase
MISDDAAALYARDPSAGWLGIELLAADDTGATVRMTVRSDMCNGFEIAHGGIVFLLADSAMAFASNSQAVPALATTAEIDWLAPVRAGQTLTAKATNRWSSRRTALWDITVTNDDDAPVALFRGRTRQVPNAAQ